MPSVGVYEVLAQLKRHRALSSILFFCLSPRTEPPTQLITRLPFMDDLSMVVRDLKKLLDDSKKEISIIMDLPELLLLSPSNENKTATILAFSQALRKSFTEVHYLCRKPSTPFELPAILEMSKLLVQQF